MLTPVCQRHSTREGLGLLLLQQLADRNADRGRTFWRGPLTQSHRPFCHSRTPATAAATAAQLSISSDLTPRCSSAQLNAAQQLQLQLQLQHEISSSSSSNS